jgi:hypothetical protein
MAASPIEPIDVLLVGSGERAEAWDAVLQRASGVRRVARARGRGFSLDHAEPSMRIAAALPPRAGLALALALAAEGRGGSIEAPLDGALADATLPEGARAVRVAHGWCALAGRAVMADKARSAQRARIEVTGLPEADGRDLGECLWHALALTRALFAEAHVRSARREGATLRVELGPPSIELRVTVGPSRLSVELGGERTYRWSVTGDEETLEVAGGPARTRRAHVGAERAVVTLAGTGDDLFAAREVAIQQRAVEREIGLGTNLRALDASARMLAERPEDLCGALGLSGALPDLGEAPALHESLPPGPFELWSFRAGYKPVAFLTVEPGEVERTLAPFGDVHVVRRERRVAVGAQDAWDDRRDRGAPRVELYVSRERALAERAAELQADGNPSAALDELGALLGYPRCCVEAFAALPDRRNNTAHRYAAAHRTRTFPWPGSLSNLFVVVLPWYVCRYDCAPSRERVSAALAALDAAHPGERARVEALLHQPVLYFTHDHQLVLDGIAEHTRDGVRVRHRGAARPSCASSLGRLGGVIAAGDELELDHHRLVVRRGGAVLTSLERTDPGLGFVAPFVRG